MKDQFKDVILDSPFEEDVQPSKVKKKNLKVILTEGETVIWKGKPNHSRSVFDKNYSPLFFMPRLFKYFDFLCYSFTILIAIPIAGEDIIPVLIMTGLTLPFLPIYHYMIYKKKKNTEYILTSKKLVFINWNLGIKKIDFIPLSNIKNVSFEEDHNYNQVGHIYFTFKNEKSLSEKTQNFIKNSTFDSPFFKNVKGVKEVFKLMNKRTKNMKIKKHEKRNTRRHIHRRTTQSTPTK